MCIIYKHLLFSRIIVVLLMIFFTVQVINLMLSICLFLPLFPLPEKTSGKILLRLMSKSILLIFSLKSFMVSGLTFRFLIHFE